MVVDVCQILNVKSVILLTQNHVDNLQSYIMKIFLLIYALNVSWRNFLQFLLSQAKQLSYSLLKGWKGKWGLII